MNLTLLWCWKEWRAQRALLGSYAFLVFASLACVFLLASEEFWVRTGGAHVLSWFAAAGVIGVLAFAAPHLVRGEFGTKDDMFVRRLPGALRPSFQGKLLFLLLTCAAFPLVGLALGELFVTATGHTWLDLFSDQANAYSDVVTRWPDVMVLAAWAMVLVPWVWVMGIWLPCGRMAIGATALFLLLLGVATFAVLRRCEGLAATMDWRPWVWPTVPFAVVLAAVSWIRGRRGGSNARSARAGLPVLAVGLLPPAGWLASSAWEYHHPDLEHPAFVAVEGLSPDLKFALAATSSHESWYPVKVRIDLQTGAVEQIGVVYTSWSAGILRPTMQAPIARQRYFEVSGEGYSDEIYDLSTGERVPVPYDHENHKFVWPEAVRARVADDQRERWPFRSGGGLHASVVGKDLWFRYSDGTIERETWPTTFERALLTPAGRGIHVIGTKERAFYDLGQRRPITIPRLAEPYGYLVGGTWLVRSQADGSKWHCFNADSGSLEICQELLGRHVLGMLDDDRVLCEEPRKVTVRQGPKQRVVFKTPKLFAHAPAHGTLTPIALPPELADGQWQFDRIVEDRNLVMFRDGSSWGCLRIDPVTLATDVRFFQSVQGMDRIGNVLAVTEDGALLFACYRGIVRIDIATGVATVLFPRSR